MKIVKQFHDNKSYYIWGLGDDGELYCIEEYKNSKYQLTPRWVNYRYCGFGISLKEMKEIIKQFVHLTPYI